MRYDLDVYTRISAALSFTIAAEPYKVTARSGAVTAAFGIPPEDLVWAWPHLMVLDQGPHNRLVIDAVRPVLYTIEYPVPGLTSTALLLEIHSSSKLRLSADKGARLLEYCQDSGARWLLFLLFSGHCVEFSYAGARYAVCRSYERLSLYARNRAGVRVVWES